MARFYLHLRDGTDIVIDEEGREFPDLEAVRKAVVDCSRDVLATELKNDGLIDLRNRIDAEDESGKLVYSLPFADVVTIRR